MWGGTWDVHRFEEIDSTNAYLQRQARLGAPEGTVAVAEHQSAGRGRLDRRWEAPPGASLLASVLFRPELDPSELHLCTAAMALAAAEACRRVAGVGPVLKWPNDVLVGEEKLAGVLAEAELRRRAGGAVAVVVGIGLNVDWPGPAGAGGTCLRELGAETGGPAGTPRCPARRPLRPPGPPGQRGRPARGGGRAAQSLRHPGTAGPGGAGGRGGRRGGDRDRRCRPPGGADAHGPRTVSAGDVVHLRPG